MCQRDNNSTKEPKTAQGNYWDFNTARKIHVDGVHLTHKQKCVLVKQTLTSHKTPKHVNE